jgi:hypothetical protein
MMAKKAKNTKKVAATKKTKKKSDFFAAAKTIAAKRAPAAKAPAGRANVAKISGAQADRQNGDDQGTAQETGCSRRARHEAASGPAKAGHAGRCGVEAVRAGAGCSALRGACKQGQRRQISGTQADRQNGDDQGAAQETGCRRRARHEAASGPAKAGHAGRRGVEAVRAGAGCSARRPDGAAAEP